MTFLEQAAIAAMQGILSRPIASVHTPEEVAKMAVEQAKALEAEWSRPEAKPGSIVKGAYD